MPLGEIFRGQPFKVAVRVTGLFLAMVALAGWALVRVLENTLVSEVHGQNEGESLLLGDIFDAEGRTGLVATLTQMERVSAPGERVTSLLDESGFTLTGPISIAPDFVGVAKRDLDTLSEGRIEGEHYLNVRKLDDLTLIVGRSGDPIRLAVMRLTGGLFLFALVNAVGILALGFWASRISMSRLREMDHVLAQVSEGDIGARLPVYDRNDEFDRVAIRVNHNLDRLTRLVTGMKSTASAIAHDLKTPLSHLQIALHEIADESAQGRDPGQKIDAALSEAESLNSIFDTMLRISRIEADRNNDRMKPVNLRDVVVQVTDFMQPMTEERGQSLTMNTQAVTVLADAGMLKQALVNLVVNASAHAGEGAEIQVSSINDDAGPILSVSDTGPGIPAGDRDRVLQAFVRLDAARTTPGSGLGLALVRAVVDRHDAILSLEDAEPGLRVSIQFPNFKNL
ncbi:hypothetical protein RA27_17975 [Ruegeria sp. ANG-R]|uniref:sensor histidine kinase n=1 Tax=Ruegeria sp. ANG-R TaxID=1577903 RepID=UPI0005801B7E|nr:HAMP domain-containing sensor histidine kinase [Ruegeria sp. ANG-R]KIC39044.1 hypothetical protein RA27_17975 [Ruegeria sp. ANG-R]